VCKKKAAPLIIKKDFSFRDSGGSQHKVGKSTQDMDSPAKRQKTQGSELPAFDVAVTFQDGESCTVVTLGVLSVAELGSRIASSTGRNVAAFFDLDSEEELHPSYLLRDAASLQATEDSAPILVAESIGSECTDSQLEQLCSVKSSTIHELDLSRCTRLTVDGLLSVQRLLCLRDLSLTNCTLGPDMGAVLGYLLVESRTLRCLDVSDNDLLAQGIKDITTALPNSGLTSLNLANTKLDRGAFVLGPNGALGGRFHPQGRGNAENYTVNMAGLDQLCLGLRTNFTLTALDVSQNTLGVFSLPPNSNWEVQLNHITGRQEFAKLEGGIALGSAITGRQHIPPVAKLEGAIALGSAIKGNSVLSSLSLGYSETVLDPTEIRTASELYLAGEGLDSVHATVIAAVIEANQVLTALDISNNCLSHYHHDTDAAVYDVTGTIALCRALGRVSTFVMRENDLGGSAGQNQLAALVSLLEHNQNLTKLDVSLNPFKCSDIDELITAAEHQGNVSELCSVPIKALKEGSLTHLTLPGAMSDPYSPNIFCWRRVLVLLEYLGRNTALRSLDLSYSSDRNDYTIDLICRVLRQLPVLSTVNLMGNSITPDQARMLIEVMEQHQPLCSLCGLHGGETDLNLSESKLPLCLEAGDFTLLSHELKTNATLTSLDLSGNEPYVGVCGMAKRWTPTNDDGVLQLAEALKDNDTLTSLNISRILNLTDPDGFFPDRDIKDPHYHRHSYGDGFSESLTTSDGFLKPEPTEPRLRGGGIFVALLFNITLTSLNLSSNCLGGFYDRGITRKIHWLQGAKAISSVLAVNKVLRILDLSGNLFDSDAAAILAHSISASSSLCKLTFGDSSPVTMETTMTAGAFARKRLGVSGALILAAFLPRCQALVSLDISGNHIHGHMTRLSPRTFVGGKIVPDVSPIGLQCGKWLWSATQAGIRAVACAVQQITALREFTVSGCSVDLALGIPILVDDDGAQRDGPAVTMIVNAHMREEDSMSIDFSGCALGPSGAALMASFLPKCRNLLVLHVANNSLGAQGARHLAGALYSLSVRSLNVAGNKLHSRGVAHIARALAVSSSVAELDISNNQLSRGAAKYGNGERYGYETDTGGLAQLSAALETNYSLTALDMSYNSVVPDDRLKELFRIRSIRLVCDQAQSALNQSGWFVVR
jgi:Ran GTPase-activating protein (RanGAP) involved in mRNA processing and transport